MNHQATLDFLSNLTPGSSIYNETVQKLRRSRRHTSSHKKYFHKRINSQTFNDQINETVLNRTVHLHANSSEPQDIAVAPAANQTTNKQHNVEKYLKKYKNHMKNKHMKSAFNENQTPLKVSQLILNDSNIVMDCKHLMIYSFLFVGVYVVFGVCLVQFLFMTESAVFTVAVVSSSLPVSGIFWSLFELTTNDFVGKLIETLIDIFGIYIPFPLENKPTCNRPCQPENHVVFPIHNNMEKNLLTELHESFQVSSRVSQFSFPYNSLEMLIDIYE